MCGRPTARCQDQRACSRAQGLVATIDGEAAVKHIRRRHVSRVKLPDLGLEAAAAFDNDSQHSCKVKSTFSVSVSLNEVLIDQYDIVPLTPLCMSRTAGQKGDC